MKEYIELGPTPSGEDCEQVGSVGYSSFKAKSECQAFINQLNRVFGPPPEGGHYSIKTTKHDFGSYQEVCIYYDEPEPEVSENEEEASTPSMEYAFKVERELPESWDEEAKKELRIL